MLDGTALETGSMCRPEQKAADQNTPNFALEHSFSCAVVVPNQAVEPDPAE